MMNPRRFCWLILACAVIVCVEHGAFATDAVVVRAPGSNLRVELSLRDMPGAPAQLVYQVLAGDRTVVLPSALGVRLADGTKLGGDCELTEVAMRKVDEGFEQFPGKRRLVANLSNEATLTLRQRGEPRRRWQVIVRAYDDGIALRYRFPYQASWPELELAEELTEFNFPAAAVATALPLAGFTTSHENLYERRPLPNIPQDWLIGPPLLVELPGTGWTAVLEANLKDYAGMYLARADVKSTTLVTRLAPRPDEPKLAVRAILPHLSPWRVILFAPQAEELIESDLLLKLNLPSEIADTSWIRPGKTTFPWWNDFYEAGCAVQDGPQHCDCEALHRLLCRARHPVPFARRR